MPNVMQSAAAWLGGQLKVHAERTVVIEYGENRTDSLTAWCAKQEYLIVDSEGFETTVVSYDWQFLATDVVTAINAAFVFRDGFVIEESTDDLPERYEVAAMGSRPCCERLDTTGVILTVHTRQVA